MSVTRYDEHHQVTRFEEYYELYQKIDLALQSCEEVYEDRLANPLTPENERDRNSYITSSTTLLHSLMVFAQEHFKTKAKAWIDTYKLRDSFNTLDNLLINWVQLSEEKRQTILISTTDYAPKIRAAIDNLKKMKADLQIADEKTLGPDVRAALNEKASSIRGQLEGIQKQTAGIKDLLANLQAQEAQLEEEAEKVLRQLAAIQLKE